MPICMHPTAQIIAHARDIGAYTTFHQGEIPYLCATSALNDAQKVLWLWLAHRMAPNLKRGVQYPQEYIGGKLGRGRTAMNTGLKALQTAGFLQTKGEHRHACHYFIQLPAEGMAALATDPRLEAIKIAVPTLYDYRQHGHFSRLSRGELDFVLEHPTLSNLAKLTWCLLANQGALTPELRVRYSYKALGALLGKEENTMNKVIDTLKAQGFIHFAQDHVDCRHWLTLTLPESGLTLLAAVNPRAGATRKKRASPALRPATPAAAPIFVAHKSDKNVYKEDKSEHSSDISEHNSDKIVHHLNPALSTDCSKVIITINSCSASVDGLFLMDAASVQALSVPVVTVAPQLEALETGDMPTAVPVAKLTRVLSPQYLVWREAMRLKPDISHVEAMERMHARFADPVFYEKICRFHAEAAAAKEAAYLAGICPAREAWALPLPDAERYRPPGNEGTSMSERVCNYWIRHVNARKDAIKADPAGALPLSEEEQRYQWRALRAPRLQQAPFPQGSALRDMDEQGRLQQLPHYMAFLQQGAHLPVAEMRHWRRILWERSHQMGFAGALNFYVFDSFCPLAQVLIRLAMRSPTPPMMEKVVRAPRGPRRKPTKATHGDYPVLEQLEARVRADIPRFIYEGELHPDVAKRGASAITEEVLFYLAKHHCAVQQSDCLKMAYMVCRNGKWNTPIGMYMNSQDGFEKSQ